MWKLENQATLFSFASEEIITEEQKIMDLLGRFTAQMLFEGMRECHPKPEWGGNDEEYDCCNTWRFYYINECRRRGLRVLEQLGWSTDEDSLYVNLHTGDVERLIDIANSTQNIKIKTSIADQVWSVIENWEPYNPNVPNEYRITYIKREIGYLQERLSDKNKSKTEIKYDKNRLKEYQAELEVLRKV